MCPAGRMFRGGGCGPPGSPLIPPLPLHDVSPVGPSIRLEVDLAVPGELGHCDPGLTVLISPEKAVVIGLLEPLALIEDPLHPPPVLAPEAGVARVRLHALAREPHRAHTILEAEGPRALRPCRCILRQLSEAVMRRRGFEVSEPPRDPDARVDEPPHRRDPRGARGHRSRLGLQPWERHTSAGPSAD